MAHFFVATITSTNHALTLSATLATPLSMKMCVCLKSSTPALPLTRVLTVCTSRTLVTAPASLTLLLRSAKTAMSFFALSKTALIAKTAMTVLRKKTVFITQPIIHSNLWITSPVPKGAGSSSAGNFLLFMRVPKPSRSPGFTTSQQLLSDSLLIALDFYDGVLYAMS